MRYLFFIMAFLSVAAFAGGQHHSCTVLQMTQTMDIATGKNLFEKAKTLPFPVTTLPHENPYFVDLVASDGSRITSAKVDTGTLIGTAEGDLVQAHAYIQVEGKDEYLGLVMAITSPMARSNRFFTFEYEKEIKLINIDLECRTLPSDK